MNRLETVLTDHPLTLSSPPESGEKGRAEGDKRVKTNYIMDLKYPFALGGSKKKTTIICHMPERMSNTF